MNRKCSHDIQNTFALMHNTGYPYTIASFKQITTVHSTNIQHSDNQNLKINIADNEKKRNTLRKRD